LSAPSTTSAPLSAELRRRTSAAHAGAEASPYLTALAEGRLSRDAFAALLCRLRPVYAALEEVAEQWSADPVVGRLVLPGLARSARLEADLVRLQAADGAPSPAARAYAGRVRRAGRTRAGFVAHHYTRYLGDLSGGQVMRAAVERSLGLTDGDGASFFAFPDLRPGVAKKAYRAELDVLPFDDDEREQLVVEALAAYRLNVALTGELDALLAADPDRWALTGAPR